MNTTAETLHAIALWWALPAAITFAWMALLMHINEEPLQEWSGCEIATLSVLGIIWPLGAGICFGLTVELYLKKLERDHHGH